MYLVICVIVWCAGLGFKMQNMCDRHEGVLCATHTPFVLATLSNTSHVDFTNHVVGSASAWNATLWVGHQTE